MDLLWALIEQILSIFRKLRFLCFSITLSQCLTSLVEKVFHLLKAEDHDNAVMIAWDDKVLTLQRIP